MVAAACRLQDRWKRERLVHHTLPTAAAAAATSTAAAVAVTYDANVDDAATTGA